MQSLQDSLTIAGNQAVLFDDEWEVQASRTQQGRGDLVFTDGAGRYAVVEVKWIDLEGLESQSRTRRTIKQSNRQKRKQVKDQACGYAEILLNLWEDAEQVQAFIFTNEQERPELIDPLNRQAQER